MAASKSLAEHLRAGTFVGGRHAKLLEGDLLPAEAPPGTSPKVWKQIRLLQVDFQEAGGTRLRKVIIEELLERMRELGQVARPRLGLEESLALRLGLGRAYDPDPEVDAAIRRRWMTWQREHGADWESGRAGVPPPPSLKRDETLKVLARDRRRAAAPPRPRRVRLPQA